MKIPGWLKSAARWVWPIVREEAKTIAKAEIEALANKGRMKYGPADRVPSGTTGPRVITEEKKH